MMDVCSYVLQIIGGDLSEIGAKDFRQISNERDEVCIFSAAQHTIAIPYSMRDGITCFLTEDLIAPDEDYVRWKSLWAASGMEIKGDDLAGFIAQFPEEDDDMMSLVGEKLRDFLAASRPL